MLLSEMYFGMQRYKRSFEVLESAQSDKNSELLAAEFAISLYNEKEYTEAVPFFSVAYKNDKFRSHQVFVKQYASCLARTSEFEGSGEVIMSSNLRDKELILAYHYHNEAGQLAKADEIYSEGLSFEKRYSDYWKDHIRLKIALGDIKGAEDLLDTVTKRDIHQVYSDEKYYEFQYLEIMLDAIKNDTGSLNEKANKVIRSRHNFDFNNDIIKLIRDISVIKDDSGILGHYSDMIRYIVNNKSELEGPYIDLENISDAEKKKIAAEINYYYLLSKKDRAGVDELFLTMISENIMDNTAAKRYLDHLDRNGLSKNSEKILMSILKSEVDGSLKTKAREILRGEELS
ncbi:MAG: hypothetical protein R6V47_00455 [Candidatus Delongbacteria bacterium]